MHAEGPLAGFKTQRKWAFLAANIASADRNYCWNGKGPDQRGAQIDLVVESNALHLVARLT